MERCKLLLPAMCLYFSLPCFAQSNSEIEVPNFNDAYSGFVRQLESGNTNIDYKAFRLSFLESQQFNVKSEKGSIYDSLKKEMFAAARMRKYQEVIRLSKAMLNIDYTSQYAHKYLQQTYKILGDTANRNKYHSIEFGLIYSISRSGDAKSCATSWEVIQVEEEYFALAMIDARLQKQSIVNSGDKICDRMDIITENGDAETYYFDVTKLMAKTEKEMNIRHH